MAINSIIKIKSYILLFIAAFINFGCVPMHLGFNHYIELKYALDETCIFIALKQIPEINEIKYTKEIYNYESHLISEHKYEYKCSNCTDEYQRVIYVKKYDGKATKIIHLIQSIEPVPTARYSEKEEKEKLSNDVPMTLIENKVQRVCNFNGESFEGYLN